ncbi:hypothetical protein BC835DRAFT_370455 [Cytidiella melzeri]|nr:hypothetical protein BC835DRAFT_370455 [Cytidiella melzeri]
MNMFDFDHGRVSFIHSSRAICYTQLCGAEFLLRSIYGAKSSRKMLVGDEAYYLLLHWHSPPTPLAAGSHHRITAIVGSGCRSWMHRGVRLPGSLNRSACALAARARAKSGARGILRGFYTYHPTCRLISCISPPSSYPLTSSSSVQFVLLFNLLFIPSLGPLRAISQALFSCYVLLSGDCTFLYFFIFACCDVIYGPRTLGGFSFSLRTFVKTFTSCFEC